MTGQQRSLNGVRPLVGIVCCNEQAGRPVQAVASRFVAPLTALADASVLLIPAIPEAVDLPRLAAMLDGLLLTGARSHVAPERYGGAALPDGQTIDRDRDTVALGLAGRMIDAGKPVFGICRGLQEINVLFGGSLGPVTSHHPGAWDGDYDALFDHAHDVELPASGRLATATGARRLRVNSVHQQGIDRLGAGLSVEATGAEDGLIEAVSACPCGSAILGVQWHPEWDCGRSPASRAFFTLLGAGVRGHHFQQGDYQ
ncbi:MULTISPECIES: gamma-glutamyl-gamma-aminobutyrate hydrolase family protein [Sphingomonas]|uniref:gamma-glutamyl-gamma-aminobutyrate hydrolase family protein n=1 Tax=Sphingomonas TaxID=13687 RepID=UPI00193B1E24|nr:MULTISPECIES: gamma-glutamyl-gamma-aminobutyrate hydrolase family protein [Sphingomonas]